METIRVTIHIVFIAVLTVHLGVKTVCGYLNSLSSFGNSGFFFGKFFTFPAHPRHNICIHARNKVHQCLYRQ